MAKTHEYPVTINWSGGRSGSGSAQADTSGTSVDLAVPPEFGGQGGATNPEELMTNAVAACYTMMFGIIADMQKIPVKSVETKAVGEVEENGPQFTYTKVTIRPTITMEDGADDAARKKAEMVAEKAESYCIVTSAIKGQVEVALEPTIQ